MLLLPEQLLSHSSMKQQTVFGNHYHSHKTRAFIGLSHKQRAFSKTGSIHRLNAVNNRLVQVHAMGVETDQRPVFGRPPTMMLLRFNKAPELRLDAISAAVALHLASDVSLLSAFTQYRQVIDEDLSAGKSLYPIPCKDSGLPVRWATRHRRRQLLTRMQAQRQNGRCLMHPSHAMKSWIYQGPYNKKLAVIPVFDGGCPVLEQGDR